MHRKRGALDAPRIVAGAKETACTRVISSPYRITESAEIPSRLNPLLNPALLGFQSVEIQASGQMPRSKALFAAILASSTEPSKITNHEAGQPPRSLGLAKISIRSCPGFNDGMAYPKAEGSEERRRAARGSASQSGALTPSPICQLGERQAAIRLRSPLSTMPGSRPAAGQRPNTTPPRRSRPSPSCLPGRPWWRPPPSPSRFSWRSWWWSRPNPSRSWQFCWRSRPGPSSCPW